MRARPPGVRLPLVRWGIAVALFATALVTRLPFRTAALWEHDSVLYARGIDHFDPAAHSPHPPGAFWYVLLARAVHAFTGDANAALTLISAVASAAAVALLYALAARTHGELTGRAAAVLLLTSVSFWGQGAVAYPYTLLAALTIAVALLLWSADNAPDLTRGRRHVLASLGWGVAIGLRADLAFALAPLWLLTAARIPLRWKVQSLGAVALPVLAWVTASSLAMPGGLVAFVAAAREQSAYIRDSYSVLAGGTEAVMENARSLTRYLWRALYTAVPLAAAGPLLAALVPRRSGHARSDAFVLTWTLAPLPVYLLVHIGEYGYVFTMLPGLCVLGAAVAAAGAAAVRVPAALPAGVAAVAAANAAIFLFTDTPLSAGHLERRGSGILAKAGYVRDNVPPGEALLVSAYDHALVRHYVGPEYRLLRYEPEVARPFDRPVCPPDMTCPDQVTVIAWDDRFRTQGERWRTMTMPKGARLRLAHATRHERLVVREKLRLGIER